jgi:hypothetical protein
MYVFDMIWGMTIGVISGWVVLPDGVSVSVEESIFVNQSLLGECVSECVGIGA